MPTSVHAMPKIYIFKAFETYFSNASSKTLIQFILPQAVLLPFILYPHTLFVWSSLIW